jgi:energy-converting hydrogenase Eha subunit C
MLLLLVLVASALGDTAITTADGPLTNVFISSLVSVELFCFFVPAHYADVLPPAQLRG